MQLHSFETINSLQTLYFNTNKQIIMRKVIKKGQELTHGPMPNELMQPLCGYSHQLPKPQQPNNNNLNKMVVDSLHLSPIGGRVNTPTRLFQNCSSQSQPLKQAFIQTDLVSTPRSQNVMRDTVKSKPSCFRTRFAMTAGNNKLSLSDQRLQECAIKPLPSPSMKSVNIIKPRTSGLGLSLDQASREDEESGRTAKAGGVTQKTETGKRERSLLHLRNKSSNGLAVIDEIDELFRPHRQGASQRRQSIVRQKEATVNNIENLKNNNNASDEKHLDPWQLTNPSNEQHFTMASVTPPLQCADKFTNSRNSPQDKQDSSRLDQLQEPFERLFISPRKKMSSQLLNTPFNLQDQEMIVSSQNDRIPQIQQIGENVNGINKNYYNGVQGLRHQHHLVQEQAAQISGNKTKSHLPDDFVHIKNFKNLDSMHANFREASPENQPSGRKSRRDYFNQSIQEGELKELRRPRQRNNEDAHSSQSQTCSDVASSEFWPQDSQLGDQAIDEAGKSRKGVKMSKNKSKQKSAGQGSVITDLDSMLMTDSIDQIVEVTPNNIIYNQCQYGLHGQGRCMGGSRGSDCPKVSHGSKKKQNNQQKIQLKNYNQNQQKEQLSQTTPQSMEQSQNYVSRARISSLTRCNDKNQSSNSPVVGRTVEAVYPGSVQAQDRLQSQAAYVAGQNWSQGIYPFQSKFNPVTLTGTQMDDPSIVGAPHAGLVGGSVNTPGSIASRFFGQNHQEFRKQSTQNPDELDENIEEEMVHFQSAVQTFKNLSQQIQQHQAQHLNIIQKVMDDDLAQQNQNLLAPPGVRQLNPFQVNNYRLNNNLTQMPNCQPGLEQQRTPPIEACEDDASAFARKSSNPSNGLMMPHFMQKAASSSKENSGETGAHPNPLVRLRQELRNQQTTSNLYDQIQLLAEQLKLSQQMMSVEAEEYNMYREDKVQQLEELQQQVDKKLKEQLLAAQDMNRSQSQSQKSSHPINASLDVAASRMQEQQEQQLGAKYQSFINTQQQGLQPPPTIMLPPIREVGLPLSQSVIVKSNTVNQNQQMEHEDQPVHTQEVDDDVICISPSKKMIKKRSFVEVQQRRQQDNQREGATGSNDRSFSEHKSSRVGQARKRCTNQRSNQRMREGSEDLDEQLDDHHSDHLSMGQKSGSSQLRSVKSLRKKNIQKEKSAFSAKKNIEADLPEDQEITDQCQMNIDPLQLGQFGQQHSVDQGFDHGYNQPSALQRMIGPLTISERHQRILKFITKKHNKNQAKKFTYECRKQVAEKRLRIKGRFVTKQQAFQILGLKEDNIQSNEALQRLLEQHYNINNQTGTHLPFSNRMSQIMHFQLSKKQNSVQNPLNGGAQPKMGEDMLQATGGRSTIQVSSLIQNADGTNKTIKIRNFQALFDQAYSNQASYNDTPQNEAMMTNENSSSQTHHSYSESKESLDEQMRKLQQMNNNANNGQAFSQGALNYQMSLVGSKMAIYNPSASTEYYNQQMSILDLQQALRIQDEQNASATNSLLENLVQPPVFKVERIDKDDMSQGDGGLLPANGDGSERDASYNKFENDSESLCNDEDQKLLEED